MVRKVMLGRFDQLSKTLAIVEVLDVDGKKHVRFVDNVTLVLTPQEITALGSKFTLAPRAVHGV